MVMFSNVIYFEEYLMEKGAYYILLLSFCSWFRIDPLESFSREQFSSVAQHDSKSIRLIDVVATQSEVMGLAFSMPMKKISDDEMSFLCRQ